MDNTIVHYKYNSSSSDEYDDSSDEDLNSQLLSNNIGIQYKNFNIPNDFMNKEKSNEYESIRNKYFTPEISKIRLLIDSKNIDHTLDHSTSNYTIHFDGENVKNKTNGYGILNNVIGFKLIKAMIHNSFYNVNDNNKNLIFQMSGSSEVSISLTPGNYTFTELGNHLINTLNSHSNLSGFSIKIDNKSLTYEIKNTSDFRIKWYSSRGYAYRLFGFLNIDDTEYSTSHISNNIVQQNTHFVDLVIPEIPYIACKKNNTDKNIIERIPLNQERGSLISYSTDINLDNYFYPIIIDKLTIQLYEDTSDTLYDCQNNDNAFEFELTILNKNV